MKVKSVEVLYNWDKSDCTQLDSNTGHQSWILLICFSISNNVIYSCVITAAIWVVGDTPSYFMHTRSSKCHWLPSFTNICQSEVCNKVVKTCVITALQQPALLINNYQQHKQSCMISSVCLCRAWPGLQGHPGIRFGLIAVIGHISSCVH